MPQLASFPYKQDSEPQLDRSPAGSFNPPAIISSCEIENTLVGDGCQLRFSKLTNTVLGRNTFVDVGCEISDSVLLGNRCAARHCWYLSLWQLIL